MPVADEPMFELTTKPGNVPEFNVTFHWNKYVAPPTKKNEFEFAIPTPELLMAEVMFAPDDVSVSYGSVALLVQEETNVG